MFIIISPSKTQDFTRDFSKESGGGKASFENFSTSAFNKETKKLSKIMKNFSAFNLAKMMKISENLADLNYKRFQSWDDNFKNKKILKIKNKKGQEVDGYEFSPAIFAFTGDVYRPFELESWTEDDFSYAQSSLGIVSGFYGIMSPLTFLKPYRLEMGTKINFKIDDREYKNLYQFWEEKLTRKINNVLKNEVENDKKKNAQSIGNNIENENNFLLNLASVEYSKAINFKKLNFPVLNIDFKIRKKVNGKDVDKIIAIFAKRARGEMANWSIKNKIFKMEDIKKFSVDGWKFDEKNSTKEKFTFIKIKK